jgi:hypothetical protein
MMTKRLLWVAGLLSIATLACGGDPNKQANDAHDAELKSERKQQQANADDRSDTRVRAAEAQRDNTDANATGSPATRDRTSADAKLTETKEVHRAKATERLEKLDARTSELKALVDKAGAKATTSSRDALKTVDTQRGMVAQDLDQLPKVASDDWQNAKTNLDSHLDTLEGLVKKAANEVEKFKR